MPLPLRDEELQTELPGEWAGLIPSVKDTFCMPVISRKLLVSLRMKERLGEPVIFTIGELEPAADPVAKTSPLERMKALAQRGTSGVARATDEVDEGGDISLPRLRSRMVVYGADQLRNSEESD